MSTQITKIINPETGKKITVGGPTYQQLLDRGYKLKGLSQTPGEKAQKRYQESVPSSGLVNAINRLPSRHEVSLQRPGNRTKGWGEVAPKRGRARQELYDNCGDKCFLIPENKSFPICAGCDSGNCACELDCRGLSAAKIRAHQWKYANLYETIDRLGRDKCNWD